MNLQKLRLGQLKPADGATTVGDVHFSNVKLLLPFEGSNGDATTTDSSNTNHSSFTFSGGAQISSGASKMGSTSLYLDGAGDYLTLGANSNFAIASSSDFTFEVWIKTDTISAMNSWVRGIFTLDSGGGAFSIALDDTSGLRAGKSDSGSWSLTGAGGNVGDDQWHHVALVRNSGTTTLYVDGTSAGSYADTDSYSDNSGSPRPLIGTRYDNTKGNFKGYMDDLRLTVGVARYTSNFTPPTTAHLTSAGDVNKHIVVNSDADGVAIGTGGINQARIAKAWVKFDGSAAAASMIQSSYNVSSMTDNGTGQWAVNFSAAMSDSDYSAVASFGGASGYSNSVGCARIGGSSTASLVQVSSSWDSSGTHTYYDFPQIHVQVFGN